MIKTQAEGNQAHQADHVTSGPSLGVPLPSTRDRILDAALDHFVDRGFDGTSLRQIAESVGITKAALYYYFTSKDDLLAALHQRLQEYGCDLRLHEGAEPVSLEKWAELLEEMIDQILAHPKLFLMRERNRAALERLSREDGSHHEDIYDLLRTLLADTRVPLDDRIRMAASFGLASSSPFLCSSSLPSADTHELSVRLRAGVRDVLSAHLDDKTT